MKKIMITLMLVLNVLTVKAKEITGTIESKIRTKDYQTTAGSTFNVVYGINFSDSINEDVTLKLDYDEEYLKMGMILVVDGENGAACKILDKKNVKCFNAKSKSINLNFRVLKDFNTDKVITTNVESKKVKFRSSDVLTVKMNDQKAVDSKCLTLLEDNVTISVGKDYSIQYLEDNKDKREKEAEKISFSSSNPEIAIVSDAGVITGVSEGAATVTLTKENCEKKLQVLVNKKQVVLEEVRIADSIKIKSKEAQKLDISFVPADVDLNTVVMTIGNNKIAWIDREKLYLIGLNPGTTELKIKSDKLEKNVKIEVISDVSKKSGSDFKVIILLIVLFGIIYALYKFVLKGNLLKPKDKTEAIKEETLKTDSDDEEYFEGIDIDI